jgi:hypothetical protein
MVGYMSKSRAGNCVRGMTFTVALLLAVAALPLRAQEQITQVDLSGSWALQEDEGVMERVAGPVPDDFTGIPLNAAGRDLALDYNPGSYSEPERICLQETPWSLAIGPWAIRIWPQVDPATRQVVAWMIGGTESHPPVTIWMDGRPRPSALAPHERSGFTSGTWKGDMLVAYTTDLKAGILRRSGAFSSDQTTLTSTFIRHDEMLAVAYVLQDPVYLTEPYVYSNSYLRSDSPVGIDWDPCIVGYEGVDEGTVPFYLPGKNPLVGQMKQIYGIPEEASLGGAETMYPEFRDKIKAKFVMPPGKCTLYCTTGFAPPPPASTPRRPAAGS